MNTIILDTKLENRKELKNWKNLLDSQQVMTRSEQINRVLSKSTLLFIVMTSSLVALFAF